MEIRNKALRSALKDFPRDKLKAILASCGLTQDEQKSLLEHNAGADLQWIATSLHTSDRSVDRRRASGLSKLRRELEQ